MGCIRLFVMDAREHGLHPRFHDAISSVARGTFIETAGLSGPQILDKITDVVLAHHASLLVSNSTTRVRHKY